MSMIRAIVLRADGGRETIELPGKRTALAEMYAAIHAESIERVATMIDGVYAYVDEEFRLHARPPAWNGPLTFMCGQTILGDGLLLNDVDEEGWDQGLTDVQVAEVLAAAEFADAVTGR